MRCFQFTSLSILLVSLSLAACGQKGETAPQTQSNENRHKPAPTVANTPTPDYGPFFAEMNAGLPQRGESLPPIAGTTLDGSPVNNATLKGKTALINLWFYH